MNTPKKLGLVSLTSLVAGNMIGSGAFLMPASLAAFGTIGLAAWILTAIGIIFLALVYARLSRRITKPGGPYAYCRAAYGDFTGFQIAYNYWLFTWVGNAAISVGFVSYLALFFPSLATNSVHALLTALAALWALTLINMGNIRLVGGVQLVTTIIKLIPLILMAFIGIFYIHPENLMHFNVTGEPNIKALLAAGAITLWTFTGFESATIPVERVEDPAKLIPRATILGTLLVVLLYILSAIAVMGILPFAELSLSTAPYADAAKVVFGETAAKWVAIAALIAVFGELNGWVLLQGEMPLAAARDGMFPKVFAKTCKNGSPILGLIISSLLVSALLLLRYNDSLINEFTFIILLATFAALIPYIHTSLAELLLLLRAPAEFDRKVFYKAGFIAAIAFAYSFWAIIGAGQEIVYYGVLLYFTGVPIYFWVKRSEHA